VTPALRAPVRRIAIAVALSLLFHYAVLWLPQTPPSNKEVLPALTVKLESLARPAAAPVPAVPEPQIIPSVEPQAPITASRDATVGAQPAPTAAPISLIEPQTATVNHASVSSPSDNQPAELVQPEPRDVPDTAAESNPQQAPNALPKYAQLKFVVYRGSLRTGEARHQLDINGGEYILQAFKQTTGLAKLVSNTQSTQTSRGKADQAGLQPALFTEEIVDGNTQNVSVIFDWLGQQLHFSSGNQAELLANSQDSLSVLYQLSQLSLQREIIPLVVSNGLKVEKYQLEIGAHEEIATPMGLLRAVHLRQLHAREEGFFEVWLGLDFRLMPVKILYTEPSGEVLEETVVSDIFISDQ
jgi:hypothetical protein